MDLPVAVLLFKLVKMMQEKNPEIDIKVNFAGNKEDWLQVMVDDFDLNAVVNFTGYVQGDELKRLYQSSDLLLITSTKVDDGLDAFIASKSFEYLNAGKRILGLVKDGAQKDFLKNACNALLIDSDDLDTYYNQFLEIAKSNTVQVKYNNTFLENFKLKTTSEQLEKLIDRVLK